MEFKIETVKWQWAKPVVSKNVYRDDEFVKTKTKKDAIKATEYLCNKGAGNTYTITVRRKREYFTYYRHSMPCLGGLVKYRDSHGEKYYMNPYFPRDIKVAYPEGDTVLVGFHRHNMLNSLKHPYYKFVLSEESPWIAAFKTKKSFIFGENHFILTNMDTDPTVLYSLLRLGGFYHHGNINNVHPKAHILGAKCGASASADPRRLAGQKPIKTSGGTWAQGFGYTRPYNESIFKTSLPHKLEDFGKVGSYPQATQSPAYFLETMKEKFGVNNPASYCTDKKVEKALVEAWDYFKEKAEELD